MTEGVTDGNVPGGPGVYRAMYVPTETTAGPVSHERSHGYGAATSFRPELVRAHDVGLPGPDFTDFYRVSWPGIARALSLALGDHDLGVEATDEGMARAYPRWDKLRHYDNPAGWVYRVGLNWARSYHRRLARRLPFAHPESADPAPVDDPVVRRALMELPLRLRTVVVCRLLLDWSVADTAAALGVRPGTVQSRLHRALQSLQTSLDHLR